MANEILVLYYSQSGQLKEIINNVLSPLSNDNRYHIDFKEIKPSQQYPFPWSSDHFFDIMPESVLGITCTLNPVDIPQKKYDLIILGYQVWYLSPSIPVWSLLNDEHYAPIFKDTKVITIGGTRNMWVMALKKIHNKLRTIGSDHIGNIVFVDRHNNLTSVLTIIKWLFSGDKGPYKNLPEAGVARKEIESSSKFGIIIKESLETNDFTHLQEKVVSLGGVPLTFSIKTTEQNAKRIFKIWAKKIRKKGCLGNPNRLVLIRIFKYYLLFLIFVISPFTSLLFTIIYYLFYPFTKRNLNHIALLKFTHK